MKVGPFKFIGDYASSPRYILQPDGSEVWAKMTGPMEFSIGHWDRSGTLISGWNHVDLLTASAVLYELTGDGSCCPQAHSS